ncbi:MAG: hypothetical protein Q4D99_07115 [Bacillota bacterium]|nr:hypothetical protein [Bacillota bacterium]
MKKNRLLMVIIALLMTVSMTLAFAGCGQDAEQAETENVEVTEAGEVFVAGLDESFNIAEALSDTDILETLDASGVDYYIEQYSNDSESFYLSACADDEEYDGMVGYITAYAEGDTSYEDLPDYKVLGVKDGITYVLGLATDVRVNPEDTQIAADYNKLTEAMKSLEIK